MIAKLPGNPGGVRSLPFDRTGARLATGASGGGVRIWDAVPEEAEAVLGAHRGGVAWALYSPDGRLVVSAGADRAASTGTSARRIPPQWWNVSARSLGGTVTVSPAARIPASRARNAGQRQR